MRERSLTRAYVYRAHNEFSIFVFTFTSQFIDFLRIRGEDNAPWRTFTKAFTPNELSHSVLSQTGEEVKKKKRKTADAYARSNAAHAHRKADERGTKFGDSGAARSHAVHVKKSGRVDRKVGK